MVSCSLHGKPLMTKTFPAKDESYLVQGVDVRWLGKRSRFFLVVVTTAFSLDETKEIYLLKACQAAPLASLGEIAAGPNDFWVHATSKGWVVRYHERKVGVLPGVDRPTFF